MPRLHGKEVGQPDADFELPKVSFPSVRQLLRQLRSILNPNSKPDVNPGLQVAPTIARNEVLSFQEQEHALIESQISQLLSEYQQIVLDPSTGFLDFFALTGIEPERSSTFDRLHPYQLMDQIRSTGLQRIASVQAELELFHPNNLALLQKWNTYLTQLNPWRIDVLNQQMPHIFDTFTKPEILRSYCTQRALHLIKNQRISLMVSLANPLNQTQFLIPPTEVMNMAQSSHPDHQKLGLNLVEQLIAMSVADANTFLRLLESFAEYEKRGYRMQLKVGDYTADPIAYLAIKVQTTLSEKQGGHPYTHIHQVPEFFHLRHLLTPQILKKGGQY